MLLYDDQNLAQHPGVRSSQTQLMANVKTIGCGRDFQLGISVLETGNIEMAALRTRRHSR